MAKQNKFTPMERSKTSTIESRMEELVSEGAFVQDISDANSPYRAEKEAIGDAIFNYRFRTLNDGIEIHDTSFGEHEAYNKFYLLASHGNTPDYVYFLVK